MLWEEMYPLDDKPSMEQLDAYITNPCWGRLLTYIENTYASTPSVQYSKCSGAPGWNVKYKKGGRALLTLYPREGYFTCLICIGAKEVVEAEALLPTCCSYVQEIYARSQSMGGTRWLMIDVRAEDALEDVKCLLSTRARPKA